MFSLRSRHSAMDADHFVVRGLTVRKMLVVERTDDSIQLCEADSLPFSTALQPW
jgi:hypothetical protein